MSTVTLVPSAPDTIPVSPPSGALEERPLSEQHAAAIEQARADGLNVTAYKLSLLGWQSVSAPRPALPPDPPEDGPA